MSETPNELKYAKSHEWARLEEDGTVTVGITDFAQQQLGDVVYVELPKVGAKLSAMQPFGVVESVKAASDLYSPLTGTVVAVNAALADAPEVVNADPYGQGWMLVLEPGDAAELDALLTADAYGELIADA